VATNKNKRAYKQGPPFQFRPGPDLEQAVTDFGRLCGLNANDACKVLVALAVTAMDLRFFPLVRPMAEALGGAHAFPRACVRISGALDGARRATGQPLQLDPERALFILGTVQDYLATKGLTMPEQDFWFLAGGASQGEGSSGQAASGRGPQVVREEVAPRGTPEESTRDVPRRPIRRRLPGNVMRQAAEAPGEKPLPEEEQGEQQAPPLPEEEQGEQQAPPPARQLERPLQN
jgi:hypothetical protein